MDKRTQQPNTTHTIAACKKISPPELTLTASSESWIEVILLEVKNEVLF